MSQESLLIIDDDITFTTTLARALRRREFLVYEAHNGEAAIELARREQPGKVVLDLKLAETSGLHILVQLRQYLPNANVVILTGYSSVSTAVEAIKLGAVNYLCKPATVDEILAALEQTDGDPGQSVPKLPPSVDRLEWEHIQRVLAVNDNNISRTARQLGMHRRTLQRKLQKRPVKK